MLGQVWVNECPTGFQPSAGARIKQDKSYEKYEETCDNTKMTWCNNLSRYYFVTISKHNIRFRDYCYFRFDIFTHYESTTVFFE